MVLRLPLIVWQAEFTSLQSGRAGRFGTSENQKIVGVSAVRGRTFRFAENRGLAMAINRMLWNPLILDRETFRP